MLFNSTTYAVFFLVVFAGHWILHRRERPRHLWLLVASYVFYGHWSWRFLGLILFSTVLDYCVGLGMAAARDPRRRKGLLILSLVGNLGVLGFFKYWGFFASETAALLARMGFEASPPLLNVVLPVGISFYTFQTLSYSIDVYRRAMPEERSLLRLALFVAFFPQLVAGPIVRASHFLPQLRKTPSIRQRDLEIGLTRIFWGLTKKVAIADVLGRALVDPAWADPDAYGGWRMLLAVYGYAFQIYGDFSGYSDVAIGSARLLGLDLGENFRAPYRAASFSELWRRWHISLSSWLRDYLYIPLGGNRHGPTRTYINLMLTMLLGGLWHGAAWTFVLWGAWHGGLLAVERKLGVGEPRGPAAAWMRRFLVFHLVCVGWVLFRSPDLATAASILRAVAGGMGSAGDAVQAAIGWPILLALGVAMAAHLPPRSATERLRELFLRMPSPIQGLIYGGVLILLVQAASGDAPFLYFQF